MLIKEICHHNYIAKMGDCELAELLFKQVIYYSAEFKRMSLAQTSQPVLVLRDRLHNSKELASRLEQVIKQFNFQI